MWSRLAQRREIWCQLRDLPAFRRVPKTFRRVLQAYRRVPRCFRRVPGAIDTASIGACRATGQLEESTCHLSDMQLSQLANKHAGGNESARRNVNQDKANLQKDIDHIVRHLEDMAAVVEALLTRSMSALSEPNRQLAYSVILGAKRIDELEREIDRLCLEFLARRQPAAKSLSFAHVAVKINSGLKRAGDCAESIARQILVLCPLDVKIPCQHFEEIANIAIPMLGNAFAAFVAQDPEKAKLVLLEEERVDRLRHQLGVQLVTMPPSNEFPASALSPLLAILNRLERTADQAREICQEVLYLCTGEYLKHPGGDVFRVLFVDDDNSCASQMAEAIGNSLGQSQFIFCSAGLKSKAIDVGVAEFLKHQGHDVTGRNSRDFAQVPDLEHYQVIVALSQDARRVLPTPPTKAVCLDWSIVNATESPASIQSTLPNYSEIYDYLLKNIRDLVKAAASDPIRQNLHGFIDR